MAKDANKPDSEESQEETTGIFEDRNSLVESIDQENEEIRIQDEEDMGIEQPESEDDQDGDDSKDDDKNADEESEDDEDQEESEEDQTDEEMVEIVVYGEKKMVLLSEIKAAGIKEMQQESAAEKNLHEAKELLKEVKSLKPKPDEEEESEDKKVMTPKEIAHALQYGDEDEAAKAIEHLNTLGSAQPGVTKEDVARIAKEAVAETTSTNEIFTKFNMPEDKGGFADLSEDPDLMKMARDKVNERFEKGEPNTWETYEAAGKNVREWVGKFKPEEKEISDFDKKKEKKKSIDSVKAANAVKTNAKQKDKSQSAGEVIDELAAGRPGR